MSMCQYGDCENDTKDSLHSVRVTITSKVDKESKGFCCYTHAALWLTKQAQHTHGEPQDQIPIVPYAAGGGLTIFT